jgi:hypothetical protein
VPQFFNKFLFAADAAQITNQQNPQQQFWADRRTTGFAIAILHPLSHEAKVSVT